MASWPARGPVADVRGRGLDALRAPRPDGLNNPRSALRASGGGGSSATAAHAHALELHQGKDDFWLLAPKTFFGQPSDTLYDLFHMRQDDARHTGQITLLRKYVLPGADREFQPYRTD